MPINEIPRQLNSESIARTCEAIDRVRRSRTATRHAIERSRKSLHETQALLVALRHIYLTPREGSHRSLRCTPISHFYAGGTPLRATHHRNDWFEIAEPGKSQTGWIEAAV
jgi:hypothetical protein